jgi:hypothetical protein
VSDRRPPEIKSTIALVVTVLFCLGATACGGASKDVSSASGVSSKGVGVAAPLVGDSDDDDELSERGDYGPTVADKDGDFDNDSKARQIKSYVDSDDAAVLSYGHAATGSRGRAPSMVAKHYYEVAAVGDGATACAMISPTFAKAIPEDYGGVQGPAYMRGKTCPAVMSRLFEHDHRQFTHPIVVTGVRVQGSEALVMLGSTTVPASYLTLRRTQGGSWKIVGLLAIPMP